MHTRSIVCAIAALSMGFSGLTFAQQDKDAHADHAARDEQRRTEQPREQGHARAEQPQHPAERARGEEGRRDAPEQRGERREGGDHHHFNRGDRLPTEYRSHQYVVDDWRGHRLSAPPRGYHWVQADGSFLLVAVTTGIIASILLNQ